MKVLSLARARVLLWARGPGGGEPFEVSKVVGKPIQPLCPTAPRCPADAPHGDAAASHWIDPAARPSGCCPYGFGRRGECLGHRNRAALESALFRPREGRLTRRLLEALGYIVEEEPIDPASQPTRVLGAHRALERGTQARVLDSRTAGRIVLVRGGGSVAGDDPAPRRRRLRVLPVGGNE